jgi:hypothetical protein
MVTFFVFEILPFDSVDVDFSIECRHSAPYLAFVQLILFGSLQCIVLCTFESNYYCKHGYQYLLLESISYGKYMLNRPIIHDLLLEN